MTTVMNGHAPIGADVLSREEGIALSGCEERIERGLSTFIDVGLALAEIRESRLYRIGYDTFENYCRGRWGFNDRRASQYIQAADLASTIVETGLPAPQNEGQARELTKLPEEQRAEVWREVNETDGKVTAEKIRDAADARKPDLAPTILEALADAGRDGLDLNAIKAGWPEPPAEKDLLRALEKLAKAEEIAVTATWGGSKKPRKWALASVLADLTPDVERILADAGPDGRTAWQIAFLLDSRSPEEDRVLAVLRDLLGGGRVSIVGEIEDRHLWALTELLTTETPEPPAVDSPTVPAGGSGSTSPEPEPKPKPTLTPEAQRLADEIAADSERRAAAAGIQSVLTYMTSRVLTPEALAQQYVIALAEFNAEQLRFAAKTLFALADLKEH